MKKPLPILSLLIIIQSSIKAKSNSFMMGVSKEVGGIEYACYISFNKVSFTYDWCMDSTLITESDYLKLMHKIHPPTKEICNNPLNVS